MWQESTWIVSKSWANFRNTGSEVVQDVILQPYFTDWVGALLGSVSVANTPVPSGDFWLACNSCKYHQKKRSEVEARTWRKKTGLLWLMSRLRGVLHIISSLGQTSSSQLWAGVVNCWEKCLCHSAAGLASSLCSWVAGSLNKELHKNFSGRKCKTNWQDESQETCGVLF